MKTDIPIPMTVHYPDTEEGMRELIQKTAGIHADTVSQRIQKLNCPASQKIELLNMVLHQSIT
jgi:hypothetical protein